VASESAGKKRGPKGGVKHQPGRGHDTKSGPRKKKRFQERAAKKRAEAQKSLATQWDEWDAMPPEAQQLRPEKKPKLPRPTDETQAAS